MNMKSVIKSRRTLKTMTALSTVGLIAFSPATFADSSKQASNNKDGVPIWDMAFVAIDTNDNNTVEWSEISRHYNDKLAEAGWGKDEVLNRFDHSNDNVLDEREYSLFVDSLWQNTRSTADAKQDMNKNQSMSKDQRSKTDNQDQQRAANKDNQQQKARQVSASTAKDNPNKFAVKEGKKPDAASLAADELMDMKVIGKEGKEIGSVENLLLNQQGQIVAVIAEVGGFFDIGDTHVAVPWEQASIKKDKLHLPITKDNASNYSIFKEQYFSKYDVGTIETVDDSMSAGPNIWKATDLIDDYVLLESDTGYGYITDLTFNREGKLQSVVVNAANPDFGYGYYAYPWYGFGRDFGWDPGLNYYTLPYSDRDLVGL